MSAHDEESERAKSRLGTVLRGKYRLDRVLGIGGMAAVYAASHRNGRDLAIKMLHPELSARADIRQRFLREGQAANAVKHPGVVAVLDDDVTDDGTAFLVMELLDGESLEELSERNGQRLPVETVLALGVELCDVLAASHAKGVIHRDIKPANLFLTRGGALKVLDFGIARLRDAAVSSATATGAMLGTPAFMAPEQAGGRAKEVGALTDVYAAGATLFALASGRLVHEGETSQAVVIQTAIAPARSLAAVLPDAPLPLVAAVDRALAFRREDRWTSAADMRDALRDAGLKIFGRLPVISSLARRPAPDTLQDAPPPFDGPVSDTIVATSAPRPSGPSVHPTPGARVMTTAGPVSQDASQASLASRKGPPPMLLVGLALGGALLVGVAVEIMRPKSPPTSAALVAPSQVATQEPPPASAASAPSTGSAEPTRGSTPSIAVTDLPRSRVAPSATATAATTATAAPGASTGTSRRRDPPPRVDVAAGAEPPTAKGAIEKAKCDPPFVIDASGKKIWTEGCL